MAQLMQAPTPSPLSAVKRDPDAADPAFHTPAPLSRKRRRVGGRKSVKPTQLPLSPLLSPQTVPSGPSVAVLNPVPLSVSVKREPDSGSGADAEAAGKRGPRDLNPCPRPKPTGPPTLRLNRCHLGGILHELARAHRWHDAASVVSTLLHAPRKPGSFEETRSMFVTAMEIYKRLGENSGPHQGTRSRYYLRTQKLFDVWMRKLIWFPKSPKVNALLLLFIKYYSLQSRMPDVRTLIVASNHYPKVKCSSLEEKHLVKLELALFYLSQGNIDNAYNATRTLIGKEGLQKEPILNLIHGLISYDKWYSGLPKDMQVEEFDVYKDSCATSMASDSCEESNLLDNSDDNSMVHDDSFPACSTEGSINNEDIERKMNSRPSFVCIKEEHDTLNESIDKDFRSIFVNKSDGLTCGLETSLLPLRLNLATGTSNDCFDSYWRYKSAPNNFYEDAEKCLRLALHSNPPVMAALVPLIQLLLLGDKLKAALNELEMICKSSNIALPFRLRGKLLEYFEQNQLSTISFCYEEALRRDPTCSYSIERLITMHRKGCYNTIQLLESITLYLDSSKGKPCIWEELVLCVRRLFSDWSADYEDCTSCTNVRGDKALSALSKVSSVFFEPSTRESWRVRCRWWMHHHFSQSAYTSETLTGDCKLLAFKAACASQFFGPEFPYVIAVESYLAKHKALDEINFVVRNKQNSVRLLKSLEKLIS